VTTVTAPDGEPIALVAHGPTDAPSWVVAHGVGSSPRFVLDAFGDAVTARGHRLVTYHLRGHGRRRPVTDPSGHALDVHVADLAAVIDAVRPAVVAGVSLGGHAAVALAAAAPEAVPAVVACLPAWTGRRAPGEGAHAATAARVREVGIDGLLASFRDDRQMRPWLRHVLLRDWPTHDPASLRTALEALDGGLAPTERELRSLARPLAVVAWPDDPGHPLEVARAWVAWAPHAALGMLTLEAMDTDLGALGHASVGALSRLGIG
jgi:pimeloyl-ACP methyl ester carboxylesterase